ncbi:hypothetical protein H1C71_008182 [Ictidomys tridecemlineatus]|nr:hypothetical protein H1C71_008182 [Ictidomys tridecemlineatus]
MFEVRHQENEMNQAQGMANATPTEGREYAKTARGGQQGSRAQAGRNCLEETGDADMAGCRLGGGLGPSSKVLAVPLLKAGHLSTVPAQLEPHLVHTGAALCEHTLDLLRGCLSL